MACGLANRSRNASSLSLSLSLLAVGACGLGHIRPYVENDAGHCQVCSRVFGPRRQGGCVQLAVAELKVGRVVAELGNDLGDHRWDGPVEVQFPHVNFRSNQDRLIQSSGVRRPGGIVRLLEEVRFSLPAWIVPLQTYLNVPCPEVVPVFPWYVEDL